MPAAQMRHAESAAIAAAAADMAAEIQGTSNKRESPLDGSAAAGGPGAEGEEGEEAPLLSEGDLDKMRYITLTETETIFMHVVPCEWRGRGGERVGGRGGAGVDQGKDRESC